MYLTDHIRVNPSKIAIARILLNASPGKKRTVSKRQVVLNYQDA